jgi:hypothetical protein
MRETGARTRQGTAPALQDPQAGLESDRAERDEHPRAGHQGQLPLEVLPAVFELRRERLVGRRRTAAGRGEQRAREDQPIAATHRSRAVRESHRMQGAIEEITRFVTGEDPPRAVPAVRGRREPDEQDSRLRVSKGRQGTAPIPLAAEASRRMAGGVLAPGDQPRAAATRNDLALDRAKAVAHPREYFPLSLPSARTCPSIARRSSSLVAPGGSETSPSSA